MKLLFFVPKIVPLICVLFSSTAFAFETKPPFYRSLPATPRSYVALETTTTRSIERPHKVHLVRRRANAGSADAHLAAVATGSDMEALADIVLDISADAERRGALLLAIQGWPPAERAERVDDFVKALTARGEFIQADGKAAFERGEPSTVAEKKLWAIVDMTVLSTYSMPTP